MAAAFQAPYLLQLPVRSPQLRIVLSGECPVLLPFRISGLPSLHRGRRVSVKVRTLDVVRCLTKSRVEPEQEGLVDREISGDDSKVDPQEVLAEAVAKKEFSSASVGQRKVVAGDSLSLGIREPVYEVLEVKSNRTVSTRKINRRNLLKSSGLRPRDIRSVDPSLWLTNSMPSLLVREHAILLNLGSLRAIIMQESVLVFNYNSKGGTAFIGALLPRLNPDNLSGGHSMPFLLEVVEAALHSRIQRLEQRLWDLEPRVQDLLEVLPNRLTADVLEQLRMSKQSLVELGSKAGSLRQMLLDILEDTHEIRRDVNGPTH